MRSMALADPKPMSTFERVLKLTLDHEGIYNNDHDDRGAETYRGISRRYHPNWRGWAIIDSVRRNPKFPLMLESTEFPDVRREVEDFYRTRFWDPLLLNRITQIDLAYEIFDTAVNLSPHRAITYLQNALNALNRNGALYPDLVVDGQMGEKTFAAITQYAKKDSIDLLIKLINVQQGAHYLEFMRKSPIQEKFARGWFERVWIGDRRSVQ